MATVQHEPDSAHLRRAPARLRVSPVTRASRASQVARDTSPGEAAPGRRREARPEAAAPWQYAKHVSALLDPGADLRQQRRHVRRAQRAVLWERSRLERVRKCGRVPLGDITVRGNAGIAHYTGLATCGSVHSCPVCSPKILNRRAEQISRAAANWDRAGNTVAMVTLTFPHDLGMRLDPLYALVADGFRSLISGRAWAGTPERHIPERPSKRGGMLPPRVVAGRPGMRDLLGVAATCRSIEVTHGENGWHPHAHVLFFLTGDPGAEGITRLTLYLRERWSAWITGQGYRVPHDQHGVDVSICSSAAEAGLYIAKTQDGRSAGNEIARGDLKQGRNGHRTPFEILDDFRWTGDVEDLALWHEYELATKGHQRITWSKGYREVLDLGEEQTDEEIAAEEVGGTDIALMPAEVWKRVVTVPGLDSAVLDAAEAAGLAGINALLARHGIGQAHAPPDQAMRAAVINLAPLLQPGFDVDTRLP